MHISIGFMVLISVVMPISLNLGPYVKPHVPLWLGFVSLAHPTSNHNLKR
jgi:hypothetical protein